MQETLLEFPCDFVLKVMGRNGPEFENAVLAIVRRHVADLGEGAVSTRPSRGGNYCALTVAFRAGSLEQLDALYRDLTACPHVVMAL